MSTTNIAYFLLSDNSFQMIPNVLAFLRDTEIRFSGSCWSYVVNENNRLGSQERLARTVGKFITDAQSADECPQGEWEFGNGFFSIGILKAPNRNILILEASDRNLSSLNAYLEERHSNLVCFLCKMYKEVQAKCVVMGSELLLSEAQSIFEGFPGDTRDLYLSIGAPYSNLPSEFVERANVLSCGGMIVAKRFFVGSPELRWLFGLTSKATTEFLGNVLEKLPPLRKVGTSLIGGGLVCSIVDAGKLRYKWGDIFASDAKVEIEFQQVAGVEFEESQGLMFAAIAVIMSLDMSDVALIYGKQVIFRRIDGILTFNEECSVIGLNKMRQFLIARAMQSGFRPSIAN